MCGQKHPQDSVKTSIMGGDTGGRGGPVPAGPRLLVLPQSSRRGTAAPDSHPSSKRWATTVSVIFFFLLVQGRTISAKGGRAPVSFFDIGMQTHICSPNGGQMERDIRAMPPTGKSPGPTYLSPLPIPFKAGPCVGPRRASCVILRCQVSGSRRTD